MHTFVNYKPLFQAYNWTVQKWMSQNSGQRFARHLFEFKAGYRQTLRCVVWCFTPDTIRLDISPLFIFLLSSHREMVGRSYFRSYVYTIANCFKIKPQIFNKNKNTQNHTPSSCLRWQKTEAWACHRFKSLPVPFLKPCWVSDSLCSLEQTIPLFASLPAPTFYCAALCKVQHKPALILFSCEKQNGFSNC